MYKSFFKRKQRRAHPASRLRVFLNTIIEKKAQKAAQSLSDRAQKLSQTQLLKLLYVFAILGVIFNVLIIVFAFKNHPGKTSFSITNISKPHFKPTTPHASTNDNRNVQLGQLTKLETFLDSLQQTETGRKQLIQFMEKHPRFRDSLHRFKSLYTNPAAP